MTIAAILLAADAPPDFDIPLAELPWGDDETLVEYQVGQLGAGGVDVIEVVLGAEAERIIALVAADNVEPVVLPARAAGEAAALRTGAAAVPRETAAAVVVSAHQPRPAEVYRRLIEHHERSGACVTRPSFRGAAGAPVIVNADVLAELRNVTDDRAGLEAVLRRHAASTAMVAFDSDAVLLTIDSREAYERALASLGLR